MEKENIRKDIDMLNNIINKMDFIDIIEHSTQCLGRNTFFSSAHVIFTKVAHHMLMCKTSLIKFKMTKIMQSMFSDHT